MTTIQHPNEQDRRLALYFTRFVEVGGDTLVPLFAARIAAYRESFVGRLASNLSTTAEGERQAASAHQQAEQELAALRAAINEAHGELMNAQPHIAQGAMGFVEDHVERAMEILLSKS